MKYSFESEDNVVIISDSAIKKIFEDLRIKDGNIEIMREAIQFFNLEMGNSLKNYYECGILPPDRINVQKYMKNALSLLRKKYNKQAGIDFELDTAGPHFEKALLGYYKELCEDPIIKRIHGEAFCVIKIEEVVDAITAIIMEFPADYKEYFAVRTGCNDGVQGRNATEIIKLLSYNIERQSTTQINNNIDRKIRRGILKYIRENNSAVKVETDDKHIIKNDISETEDTVINEESTSKKGTKK